jgi:hypothetical protein
MIKIGNSGTGLPDNALEDLNNVLAGQAAHTSTGRRVALVATREIARRHALSVQFSPLVSGGLVATVALPDTAFERAGAGIPAIPRATTDQPRRRYRRQSADR